MRYAILAAWQRFKEVRHQQKVYGYQGPLSMYAAFYAELGDWERAFAQCEFPPPNEAVVTYAPIRHFPGVREDV